MGWWSASILGGDEPLDYLGDLAHLSGVETREDDDGQESKLSETEAKLDRTLYGYKFSKEILNNANNLKKLTNYCDKSYSPEIAYQVLGVILLATGSNISEPLKKKIISSAEKDEWASQPGEDERVSFIQSFIAAINNYENGVPVYTTVEGLFEKISNHLTSGKTGLVNK